MEKERDIVICACHSTEHQMVISYTEDIENGNRYPEVYLHIHLNKRPFWSRVKYAVKYIFGYQCRYGSFDEMIIDKKDVDKFKKIVEHLNSL
jgi:ribosomal protein L31E